ncbi:dihydroxyacetone kinase family protein [Brachybacterium sp. NBEC-018]|uniref:dihydroxyacetone kinase family protein n=1 Tax=Brachybacterium sp. NBEC-018 TaxID=2996004 RepID=UPI002175047D|nr:dihydroxyacetone kinase family protein [Brachybacterium sp. NBEC-018]UVY84308.1 dihydroxyacetone kinase family protein [Brachybacterium sp. NBEC-018]
MTYLFDDPLSFPSDAVEGLVAAHPEELLRVHGGVVRAAATPAGQPALVVGGGSGHYPAFAGWVGPGFAHGAPCGNVFSSPSSDQVHAVARNAENGGGVLLGFGHYAGDVLHFGVAAEKLRAEGIDVRIVAVSDDIASGQGGDHRDRRGIAGDLTVFKVTGAAIQEGADLDEAERLAWKANDATRSLGVAFDGCTLPGAEDALFHVPEGRMAIGLGIHGEPGIDEVDMPSAAELARVLVDGVLEETPELDSDRVAVVLNGLGTVKHEEMFVVWKHVAGLLAERGLTVVRPEVGEHVTSLDMAGLSLTVMRLDEELERLWLAAADAPAFRRGAVVEGPLGEERGEVYAPGEDPIPEASAASQEGAARVLEVLGAVEELLTGLEPELGRMDQVAGDGDHGQGMLLGIRAARAAAQRSVEGGAGARTVLVQAGAAWSAEAGGTSGALWGAALTSLGRALADDAAVTGDALLTGLIQAVEAIERLGGAQVGDKTMVDAAVPFRESLAATDASGSAGAAITEAAAKATAAAEGTAEIAATKGRARNHGDKSVGTPDPGAISFSRIVTLLGEQLS